MIIIYQWLTPSRTCKGGSGRDQFWGFAMVLFLDLIKSYDPGNMSQEDTQSLRNDIKYVGIKPGEDLKNMLQSAGFDIRPLKIPQPKQSSQEHAISNDLKQNIDDFAE